MELKTFIDSVSYGKFRFPAHIDYLCGILDELADGKIHNLIINLPPRHGKSELISRFFPAWYLTRFPGKKIIFSSYNAQFAKLYGRRVRDIIEKNDNFIKITVDKKKRASDEFEILDFNGGMTSVGAGGSITGRGADLVIIDDPVKNDAEANSALIRDHLWDWFTATVYTRIEPEGAIILVMTRWHEDDLCGRILKAPNSGIWKVVKLPAVSLSNDLLGRNEGEALWNERFTIKKLREIKEMIGSYWFSALYQQEPAPATGTIFKRERANFYTMENNTAKLKSGNDIKAVDLNNCLCYASVDLAMSKSETADFTVIIIFYVTYEGDILIREVIREKFDSADHIKLIRNVFSVYQPSLIGIESVQYQKSLVSTAMREGLPVMELKADRDKISRSLPMAARMESGKVFFNANANWLEIFETELYSFPKGKHDDQVDAFSYIAAIISPISGIKPKSALLDKVVFSGLSAGF